MKKNFLQQMIFGAALLLAAGGCTQDELAGDGTQLPEGKYPLQISSVTLDAEVGEQPWDASHAPQTRVAESDDRNSSVWSNGDEISVKIGEQGTPGKYTMNVDGDGKVTGVTATTPAYWTTTVNTFITAWYPNSETIDLSDQSQRLAYALFAQTNPVNYLTESITLPFVHKLAKVRVIVEGSKAENVKEVKIYSYPGCTSTQGNVTGVGTKDYITMYHQNGTDFWEANVVAEQLSDDDRGKYVKLITNTDSELIVPITLNNSLQAGKINEIRINAKGKPVEINDNETYTITGNSEPIIINGSPTITFQDARITSDEMDVITIKSGNPKLKFEGTNVLRRNIYSYTYVINAKSSFSIELAKDAKLAVIGEAFGIMVGGSNSNLSISGAGELYVDCTLNAIPPIYMLRNTSLNIKDVKLTAVARQCGYGYNVAPAIGATGQKYGNTTPDEINVQIDLQNCTLKLYALSENNKDAICWVYPGSQGSVTSGNTTIDVDGVLNQTTWDTGVATLGTGVKATRLQTAPEIPEWAK